jgi:hypothetical protein
LGVRARCLTNERAHRDVNAAENSQGGLKANGSSPTGKEEFREQSEKAQDRHCHRAGGNRSQRDIRIQCAGVSDKDDTVQRLS